MAAYFFANTLLTDFTAWMGGYYQQHSVPVSNFLKRGQLCATPTQTPAIRHDLSGHHDNNTCLRHGQIG